MKRLLDTKKKRQILYKFITEEDRMQVLKDLGGGFKEVEGGLENTQHV